MTLPFEFLLALSLAFCALQLAAASRHGRATARSRAPIAPDTIAGPAAAAAPPVSILKPVSGLEDGLRANLDSFFRQDYPAYEIVFCFQDPADPALPLVRDAMRSHDDVPARIVVGDYTQGLNPKVCNLIPGYRATRHDLVLISDANVRVTPDYLAKSVAHLADPRVGMVSHLVRGVGGRTLGADLDNGYLNTFVVGSVALLEPLGRSCVIGKSMLMHRKDLERIGGLEGVRDHLAEDYVLAQRMRRAGRAVVISAAAVDRVSTSTSVGSFLRRYTRWNAMRRTIAGPAAYSLEPLANPTLLALLLGTATAIEGRADRPTVLFAGLAVAAKMAMDAASHAALGAPLRPRNVLLTPVRDLLLAYVWAAGFCTRTVRWRGNSVILGRDTRLTPGRPAPASPVHAAEPSADDLLPARSR